MRKEIVEFMFDRETGGDACWWEMIMADEFKVVEEKDEDYDNWTEQLRKARKVCGEKFKHKIWFFEVQTRVGKKRKKKGRRREEEEKKFDATLVNFIMNWRSAIRFGECVAIAKQADDRQKVHVIEQKVIIFLLFL